MGGRKRGWASGEEYSDGSGVAILKFCLVRLSLGASEIACNALQGKLFHCMLCGALSTDLSRASVCLVSLYFT